MKTFWKHIARGALLLTIAGAAVAQSAWPSRPIRFIVPFPPGGSTDVLVRTIAPRVGELLGQAIVVDYKAGAGAIIGMDAVAKAAPDGYTVGLGSPGALMASPHLSKVPYSVEKDFTFIGRLARVPAVIVTGKNSRIASGREMVELARANPGKLNYAHAGRGTMVHLAGEQFKLEAKLDLTPVAYRGAGPALQGLMGNETELMVTDLTAVWTALQNDQARALVITSTQRSALLPQVPTMTELGFPKAAHESEYGVVGPAGLPPEVTAKLASAFDTVLRETAVKEAYAKVGSEAAPSTGPEYRKAVLQGSAHWGQFIRTHTITAD